MSKRTDELKEGNKGSRRGGVLVEMLLKRVGAEANKDVREEQDIRLRARFHTITSSLGLQKMITELDGGGFKEFLEMNTQEVGSEEAMVNVRAGSCSPWTTSKATDRLPRRVPQDDRRRRRR
ncbi:unnamed protein product [Linum tenue]|uniref:Uncharacterized protein n=1 Tax=Linum tenue TaxID=586396 RepID=A0AAV0RP41_9ROSI|nr:unnamed protein product [Linum tenue]